MHWRGYQKKKERKRKKKTSERKKEEKREKASRVKSTFGNPAPSYPATSIYRAKERISLALAPHRSMSHAQVPLYPRLGFVRGSRTPGSGRAKKKKAQKKTIKRYIPVFHTLNASHAFHRAKSIRGPFNYFYYYYLFIFLPCFIFILHSKYGTLLPVKTTHSKITG